MAPYDRRTILRVSQRQAIPEWRELLPRRRPQDKP